MAEVELNGKMIHDLQLECYKNLEKGFTDIYGTNVLGQACSNYNNKIS